MNTAADVEVDVSPWREAPVETGGSVVFAVGDVHGCARQLDALLDRAAALLAGDTRPSRLVFLGDLINRGPDSLGVLRRWAEPQPIRGVACTDRLMGNHEQLLLIAAGNGAEADRAWSMSLARGAGCLLAELRRGAGRPDALLSGNLLCRVLGNRTWELLRHGLRPSVRIGNLLLVHAGVDPTAATDGFLALPADRLPDGERHWAWIQGAFLAWRGGFGGQVVVHGHTPPAKHRTLAGQDDPHRLAHDRLGLDGGSTATGIVAGAQIEDGRYRVVRAMLRDGQT